MNSEILQQPNKQWDLHMQDSPHNDSPIPHDVGFTQCENFSGQQDNENPSPGPSNVAPSSLKGMERNLVAPSLREGAQLGPESGAWEIEDADEPPEQDATIVDVKRARRIQTMPSFDVPLAPRRPKSEREVVDSLVEDKELQTRTLTHQLASTSAAIQSTAAGGALTADLASNRKQKSRRASFIDFFLPKAADPEPLQGTIRRSSSARNSTELDKAPPPLPPALSRRGSFLDFFRGSSTDLAQTSGSSPSVQSSKKPKSRRGSILDIFSGGSSNQKQNKGRRASIINLISFGALDKDGGKDEDQDLDSTWYTSPDDFKPLTQRFYSGGYKESYYAYSLKTKEYHVVKKFIREKMKPSEVANIQSMIGVGQWLRHDCIIKILGSWETDDAIYIVEEYAVHGDIMQESMSHPELYTEHFIAKSIVHPLLSALEFMHDQKIIHRSIYPEHVLMGRERQLKLGYSSDMVHLGIQDISDRPGLLDYMAPEMISVKMQHGQRSDGGSNPNRSMGKPQGDLSKAESTITMPNNPWEMQPTYDVKADIWQVGCLTHEILCGCLPFEAADKQLTAALILWADVSYWPDSISPECVSFIQACLTKDPDHRPSAKMLLGHPWLVRSCAGEVLQSQKELREAQLSSESTLKGNWKALLANAWIAVANILTEPPEEPKLEGGGSKTVTQSGAPPVLDQGTRKF